MARLGKSVRVGDASLHVEEFGVGPALIVLHGGPGIDHALFGHSLDELGNECRVVLCDLRAHGRSAPGDAEGWTIERLSSDVEDLASEMGLSSYSVFAHSFGVLVALRLAIRVPRGLRSLVLSCGAPAASFFWEGYDPLVEPALLSDEELAQAFSAALPACVFDANAESYVELERCSRRVIFCAAIYNHFAKTRFEGISMTEELHEIACPVLLLSAADDPIVAPDAAKLMHTRIARSRHVEFDSCGHFPHFERARHFLDVVRGFLLESD